MQKSAPTGSGWQSIPGSRKGSRGYRRKRGGKWQYWYPTQGAAVRAANEHREKEAASRAAADRARKMTNPRAAAMAARHESTAAMHGEHAANAMGVAPSLPERTSYSPTTQAHRGQRTLGPSEGEVWTTAASLTENLIEIKGEYKASPGIVGEVHMPLQTVDGRRFMIPVRLQAMTRIPSRGQALFEATPPGQPSRVKAIDVFMPANRAIPADSLREGVRRTLAHEVAHAMDYLRLESNGGQSNGPTAEEADGRKRYYNEPAEVTAYRHNVFRDLNTPEAAAAVVADVKSWERVQEEVDWDIEDRNLGGENRGLDPARTHLAAEQVLQALEQQSPSWRQVSPHLNPENRRKFLQMAATVLAAHVDGTSTPMAKSVIGFQGIPVNVEHPKGTLRTGVSPSGHRWSVRMLCDYGEVPGTIGGDNEPIDVFVGPHPAAPTAFIIHQKHIMGDEHRAPMTFDESKVMLGFHSQDEALAMWASHFSSRPLFRPGVTVLPVEDLRARLGCTAALADLTSGNGATKDPVSPHIATAEPTDEFGHLVRLPYVQQAIEEAASTAAVARAVFDLDQLRAAAERGVRRVLRGPLDVKALRASAFRAALEDPL